ncbi:MAG: hypothetical protein P2975_08110 [Gemmatimonadota bacterium]|nr:hypothetical protein [Gemmatimonadota bacterium]
MTSSLIDFSAQFGGRDAATAVLPHFRALKAASREMRLEGFPFPKLAYILRVDGEVNQYKLSGAGNLEIDSDRECLSVDIGIKQGDRDQVTKVICAAILSSVEQIKALKNAAAWKVDWTSLETCLSELIVIYTNELRADS